MNRVEKEFAERKNKILKSARKLFIRDGFNNVSLTQIAKEADFGKSTLYHYFASKNDILYTIVREDDLVRLRDCMKQANLGKTPYERVYNYLEEFYTFAKKDYNIFMLTYKNNYTFYRDIVTNLPNKLYEKYEKHFDKSASYLKEELKKGEQDGYFKKIADKDYQLGYIMVTTRALIFFLFQHLYITKSLTEEEVDSYFTIHLDSMLKNL